jgi:hypothetical protein
MDENRKSGAAEIQNPKHQKPKKTKKPKTKAQKPDTTGHLRTFDDHHT